MGGRRIKPLVDTTDELEKSSKTTTPSINGSVRSSRAAIQDTEPDTVSFVSASDESAYLKLKQFSKLDPTLEKLLIFLNCFGLTINFVHPKTDQSKKNKRSNIWILLKIFIVAAICAISLDVSIALNLSQSKLLSEQKRAAPLLTFVIVAYSLSTIMIPIICDSFLIIAGSNLFRFYSRTTATVCDGKCFTES